jgi:hypothetical protein
MVFVRRIAWFILIVAPLLAVGWVVLFYSFCFRVWSIIGHSPAYKADRLNAHLENGAHDLILAYGLLYVIPISFVLWLVIFLIAVETKAISQRHTVLISLGWLPMWFVVYFDPNGWFWNVYFD